MHFYDERAGQVDSVDVQEYEHHTCQHGPTAPQVVHLPGAPPRVVPRDGQHPHLMLPPVLEGVVGIQQQLTGGRRQEEQGGHHPPHPHQGPHSTSSRPD